MNLFDDINELRNFLYKKKIIMKCSVHQHVNFNTHQVIQ